MRKVRLLVLAVSTIVLAPAVPAGSAERAAETHSVYRLYRAYFLREPDAAGLAFWSERHLTCETPLAQISESFASSPEFRTRYGNLNNRQFVELVYKNVLGRTGDPTGVSFWTARLDSGSATRGEIMIGFSESPEYVMKTKTTAPQPPLCVGLEISGSVYRLFRAVFLREPDTAGERFWIGQYATCSMRLPDIALAFVSSTEFQNRYGSLTNRQFVELVYKNVLGRTGDPTGVNFWTARLDSGSATRGEVMIGFSESTEFVKKTNTAPPSTAGYLCPPPVPVEPEPPAANCHASYPTVCIPPPPPDLSCSDIPYRRFPVLPPDPHGFDGNKDGIGCQS